MKGRKMDCIKRLPIYFADISTEIVDSVFKMFLTLLLIRAMINNCLPQALE